MPFITLDASILHLVLHVGRGNPKHKYRLGGQWLKSSPKEKD